MMRLAWMVLAVGCSGKADDSGAGGGLGSFSDPDGDVATVSGTAFGFNSGSNSKLALFWAGSGTATCDDVSRALSGDKELDPTALTPSGTCSAFFYADYVAPDEASWSAAPASFVLNCAFGDGAWEETDACDAGYCYTGGHFWTGAPSSFSVTASGGDEADYAWDIDLDGGAGQYPYESLDGITLTGGASGSGDATWCADIGQSVYF